MDLLMSGFYLCVCADSGALTCPHFIHVAMRSYCWLSGKHGTQSILFYPNTQRLRSPLFFHLYMNPLLPPPALQVQPLVGLYSDRCTARWGRRRPFILIGCMLICLAVRTSEPGTATKSHWLAAVSCFFFLSLTLLPTNIFRVHHAV
jgi:hypothetical protein